MATNISALDRLKSQLLVSNIQSTNQPLYQVINQLIDFLRQSINLTQAEINALTPSGGGTPVPHIIIQGILSPLDSFNENEGETFIIPGLPGKDGKQGKDGIPGIDGLDGIDGEIGPPGNTGSRGLTGSIGPPGTDGIDGEDSLFPGPQGQIGPQGIAGIPGIPGTTSLIGPYFDVPESIDIEPSFAPGPGLTATSILFDYSLGRITLLSASNAMIILQQQDNTGPSIQYINTGQAWQVGIRGTTTGEWAIFNNTTVSEPFKVSANNLTEIEMGVTLGGELTPAALAAGNTNDYNPAGLINTVFLRVTADAAGSTITGFVGGSAGRILIVENLLNTLTIACENAGSVVANRVTARAAIVLSGIIMLANDVAGFRWSPAQNRWILLFRT